MTTSNRHTDPQVKTLGEFLEDMRELVHRLETSVLKEIRRSQVISQNEMEMMQLARSCQKFSEQLRKAILQKHHAGAKQQNGPFEIAVQERKRIVSPTRAQIEEVCTREQVLELYPENGGKVSYVLRVIKNSWRILNP